MVFAPYHEDGSCSYTQTERNIDVFFSAGDQEIDDGSLEEVYKKGTVEIIDMVKALKELKKEDGLHAKIFGEGRNAKLDLSYLTLAGHSLGAGKAYWAATTLGK